MFLVSRALWARLNQRGGMVIVSLSVPGTSNILVKLSSETQTGHYSQIMWFHIFRLGVVDRWYDDVFLGFWGFAPGEKSMRRSSLIISEQIMGIQRKWLFSSECLVVIIIWWYIKTKGFGEWLCPLWSRMNRRAYHYISVISPLLPYNKWVCLLQAEDFD